MMMKNEDLNEFLGKNIQIVLENDFQYNGYIKSVSNGILKFQDKMVGLMLIRIDEIKIVKENKKNGF